MPEAQPAPAPLLPDPQRTPPMPPVAQPQSELDVLLARPVTALQLAMDPEAMSGLQMMARMMATSKISVPEHFRGNEGDCLALCMQAALWKMSPFAVAQKTHIVGGRLGYEAQLIVAVLHVSGVLLDRFQVEVFGDWGRILGRFSNEKGGGGGTYQVARWEKKDEEGLGLQVTAWARGASKPATTRLLLAQAGTRFSTLWATDPIQQLTYLAQKKWARVNTPEVLLGVYTDDEVAEMLPASTGAPAGPTTIAALMDRAASTGGPATTADAAQALAADRADPLEAVRAGLGQVARYGGSAALERAWKDLTAEHRKSIGADGLEQLKASAVATDAKLQPAAKQAPAAPAPAPKPAKGAKGDPETGELPPGPATAALPGGPTFEEYAGAIEVSSSADTAAQHLDAARTQFGADSEAVEKLTKAYLAKWSKA